MQQEGQLQNTFDSILSFKLENLKSFVYYSLPRLEEQGIGNISKLPFSIRIVLESLLRNADGKFITEEDVRKLANWDAKNPEDIDIPLKVARVLMQDFTGVPAVVDIAALREYVKGIGENPSLISPILPVDLIIDHSVQVDDFRSRDALLINQKKEMERNLERYKLLKWAGNSFNRFNVIPPSGGICHQVNLEYLATCVAYISKGGYSVAFPDTLIGTDSHTTMINGLGVLGFGVGGIEAEAALLNQPVALATPQVVGAKIAGKLPEGVTAMDMALTLTRIFREYGVVGKFVEFFGEGMKSLSLPDRATISNMCPEYGATVSIFPVDEVTLDYLRKTGRSEEQIELVKKYFMEQGMWDMDYSKIEYSSVIEIDLSSIKISVSGPSQPKQQIPLEGIADNFRDNFLRQKAQQPNGRLNVKDYTRWASESMVSDNGPIKSAPSHSEALKAAASVEGIGSVDLYDGDVVIAAITSCTNTSNPSAMICAGLLAKKAAEKGLAVGSKVKTSLAPGSRVVTEYLAKAGLDKYLSMLGFNLVGYGCTTCIGNSGPLDPGISKAIDENNIITASVLSGNRNYEARIHTEVRANYLMSPPLVIAFAIAGNVLKDLTKEPLGKGSDGRDVYLKDIWPSTEEINGIAKLIGADMFYNEYKDIYGINRYWSELESQGSITYPWDQGSTYISLPPFFDGFDPAKAAEVNSIENAAVLAVFGDSVSTDHISPAGAISEISPAGRYLAEKGVSKEDFNTYGSRRGNHEVMMRGTFANVRIRNLLVNGEGGYTMHFPGNEEMSVYDAAMKYRQEGRDLVVIAGSEYGSGSSRDWAAKGPSLLGVKAVIAKSFERIHRSNLIGMGILPLQFGAGQDFDSLSIDASKPISIEIPKDLKPRQQMKIRYFKRGSAGQDEASVVSRLDYPIEIEYYKAGGVLHYVLRSILNEK